MEFNSENANSESPHMSGILKTAESACSQSGSSLLDFDASVYFNEGDLSFLDDQSSAFTPLPVPSRVSTTNELAKADDISLLHSILSRLDSIEAAVSTGNSQIHQFSSTFAFLMKSFTEYDGQIRHWTPIPSVCDTRGIPPQTLEKLDIPRASLKFLLHPEVTNSAPWTSIGTDLLLAGGETHVALYLENYPRLEYITPIIHASASDIPLKAPSPLRLPLTNLSLSGEYPGYTTESPTTAPHAKPSYKRKRELEMPSSAKKRRTSIGASDLAEFET
ncbi:hypothetical protein MKX08_009256 [Trichoderma sp. CBMAI-0020]|nr:hypothetical protein MKX08_009256 [Trichoderma sp. CBMAI-0020]